MTAWSNKSTGGYIADEHVIRKLKVINSFSTGNEVFVRVYAWNGEFHQTNINSHGFLNRMPLREYCELVHKHLTNKDRLRAAAILSGC